ncbi:hypothetical protein [uncultured Helicobacter sp.]|uniref:hypothetical protein n=1 Tax=uncultured Helicobacter sp. TaxID=175537 RepID=UPI00260297A9|nr:hypothetical protein [uncultured Helicobacter sp.]
MTQTAAYKMYFHIQQSLARRYISLPSFFSNLSIHLTTTAKITPNLLQHLYQST